MSAASKRTLPKDEATQLQLVQDYLDGMKKTQLMEKYNLHAPQIYLILRRHNVKPKRNPQKFFRHCTVCGRGIEYPKYIPGSWWFAYVARVCDHPSCRSLAHFFPEIRLEMIRQQQQYLETVRSYRKVSTTPKQPFRRHLWTPEPGWCDGDIVEDNASLSDAELAALERAFHVETDERFEDLSETAQQALWGRLSRLAIAVRLRASSEALRASVELDTKRPRESFLRQFFGGADTAAETLAKAFDVLYLWRCGCDEQTTYVVRTLDDIPAEAGLYGICTRCSSIALSVGDSTWF